MKTFFKNLLRKIPFLFFVIKKILFMYKYILAKKKWKDLSKQTVIKLELGSGIKKGKNGWTTVDVGDADINWDLKNGILMPNNSVDRIYSSHLLEHIPYQQLLKFLQSCHAILKVNGEFSVCVPNFRLYIDAYNQNKMFKDRELWWQSGLVDTNSAIDQLNYVAYMKDQHKYLFDEENLVNTLKKAGFSTVKLRDFDSSIDRLERDYESIYAHAIKK